MNQGWVKLHRKIQDNPLYFAESFDKLHAWEDLFLNANHKPGNFYVRGVEIKLDRGQLGWSEVTMAGRWKWSRNKVRRFLHDLKMAHQIEQQTVSKITSIITIINYDMYNSEQDTIQQKDNRRNTNKNDKNEKNIKNNNLATFEEVQNEDILPADLPLEKTPEYFLEFNGNDNGMQSIIIEYGLNIDGVRAKGKQLYDYYSSKGSYKSGKPIKNYKQLFINILKKDHEKINAVWGKVMYV